MNRKKILVVTHGFYPEQSPRSFRATELVKEFHRQGHEVKVIAPHRRGIESFLAEFPVAFEDLGQVNWRTPQYTGQSGLLSLANRATRRLLDLLFEYPKIQLLRKVRRALQTETGYDLLISIAVPYPIHWGVAAARSIDHPIASTWVADCGDPYMGQENDSFRPPFYFGWVEKWFMRKADFISVPTETSYAGYFEEFHSKIEVIPQGFRFQDIEVCPIVQDGIIRFGYGGAFIQGRRDPREFLAYLTTLPAEVSFEFHVFTPQQHLVERFTSKDKRIILHKPVSRAKLLTTLSGFQFVVNFANRGRTQTPSKLIDYAIIDKPILNIKTSELDKKTIMEFLSEDYSGQLKVTRVDRYRIENVAQSFLNLISA